MQTDATVRAVPTGRNTNVHAAPESVATVGANHGRSMMRSPAHTLITHSTMSAAAAYSPLFMPPPSSIAPQNIPPTAESPAPRAITAEAIASPNGAQPPRMVPRVSSAHRMNRCTPRMSVCRCSSFQSWAARAAARPMTGGTARPVFCLCISDASLLCFPVYPMFCAGTVGK